MGLEFLEFMLVFKAMTPEERLHLLEEYGKAAELRQQAKEIERALEARVCELLPDRDIVGEWD